MKIPRETYALLKRIASGQSTAADAKVVEVMYQALELVRADIFGTDKSFQISAMATDCVDVAVYRAGGEARTLAAVYTREAAQ